MIELTEQLIISFFILIIPFALMFVMVVSYGMAFSKGFDEGFNFCKKLSKDYKEKTGKDFHDLKGTNET